MMAVVICMVAAIAIRSLITNIYLSKIMGVSNEINVIWECVLSLIFIVINLTLPMYIAFFVYLTACHRCGCAGGRDPGKLQPEKIEAEICKSAEEYLK